MDDAYDAIDEVHAELIAFKADQSAVNARLVGFPEEKFKGGIVKQLTETGEKSLETITKIQTEMPAVVARVLDAWSENNLPKLVAPLFATMLQQQKDADALQTAQAEEQQRQHRHAYILDFTFKQFFALLIAIAAVVLTVLLSAHGK